MILYGTVELDAGGSVEGFKEKPSFQFYTNTGLYVIEPEFLNMIPEDTHIDITDVIKNCIQAGKRVGTFLIDEENWMDMGQLEEMEKMKERMGL